MIFSKACQYGLRAIILIADHEVDKIIGVKEIAEELDVSRSFLAKVLQKLVRDDLLSSIRGPGGGFFLNAANRQNSLYDIIFSIEGDKGFNRCILGRDDCSSTKPCPLHFQSVAAREGLYYQLKSYSIDQFVKANQTTTSNI